MDIKKLNEQLDQVMSLNEEKSFDDILQKFLRDPRNEVKADLSNKSFTINGLDTDRIFFLLQQKEQGNYSYSIAEQLGEIIIDSKGSIDCKGLGLTSLEGAPEKVEGSFFCHYNQLTSLEGAPKEVKGTFDCSYNELTSLEGCPHKVHRDFDCSNNKLTSLEHAPEYIGGKLYS